MGWGGVGWGGVGWGGGGGGGGGGGRGGGGGGGGERVRRVARVGVKNERRASGVRGKGDDSNKITGGQSGRD